MSDTELFSLFKRLCQELFRRECESCGGPAQHVDPDGATYCFACVTDDYESNDAVYYPGTAQGS